MKKIFPIFIAIVTGLTILAGYFFQARLAPIPGMLINWGITLVGLSGLLGIGYLVRMHVIRIARGQKGGFNSVILIASFFFTIIAGIMLTPQDPLYRNWVLNIQIPIETSLLAIVAVTLLYGSLRMIRTRGWTLMSISFLASALVSLVLNLRYLQTEVGTQGTEWIEFIRQLPLAGLRGILIGMALGGLIVGLRVLLAMDRPYEDEQ
ncbi:MAG: hypothetical protein ACNA70_00765 [Brevefilum sp.]